MQDAFAVPFAAAPIPRPFRGRPAPSRDGGHFRLVLPHGVLTLPLRDLTRIVALNPATPLALKAEDLADLAAIFEQRR